MPTDLFFIALLSFLWFIFYWIFGGVFFAVVALLRLMRLRKVRFSCLFTLASLICAVGAAITGLRLVEQSEPTCADGGFLSIVSCGFVGILTAMLLWAAALVILGFIFLALSKHQEPSWLTKMAHTIELEEKVEKNEEEL